MTNYSGVINALVIGDDLTIERTITALPSGVSLLQAWFTVKRGYADIDSAAVFQKTITIVSQIGIGVIDDTGSTDGIGHFMFYLTPVDTVKLYPLSEYKYDIQVRLSDGVIATPESGVIIGLPQVTLGS